MVLLLVVLLFQAATGPNPNTRIGPDDVVDIQVFQVPDLNRTVRVDQKGAVTLPLIGEVQVKGLTPAQLERRLVELLGEKYLNDPNVNVFVREYKSHPVSVVGAVRTPGVYQIASPKSLVEVLAMAQGLADGPTAKAGNRILITHEGETEEVDIPSMLRNDPSANKLIHPGDEIRVLPAEVIYVLGDVEKPGSYSLEHHQPVNVLQAMALAGGPKRTAKWKELVIFRKDATGAKIEVPVRLTGKMTGPDSERTLEANDILFVPGSTTKRAFARALDVGLWTASGMAVWHGR